MIGEAARVTARGIAAAVQDGADPVAITLHAARRAAENPCNAFVYVDLAEVEAQARRINRQGPLAGVPVVVKDNLADAGQPLTCASRILAGHRAVESATAIERLRAAGAVVIARANMDEFAMGATGATSSYGPTVHPVDPDATPGGSSSGSAASIALGIAPLALGSDTGGSIRVPAALCGIVGLKPGWGRVSRRGLVAHACSLDCVGVLAGDIRDAALALRWLAGPDPGDGTCLADPVPDYLAACDAGVHGLRVGWLAPPNGLVPSEGVAHALEHTRRTLLDADATVVEVPLPSWADASDTYSVLAAAEASSNLARYDGVRYGARADATDLSSLYTTTRSLGFGVEARRRLLLGTYILSTEGGRRLHQRAREARAQLTEELRAGLALVDVLICPATPAERLPCSLDVAAASALDAYTIPASLAGLPALVVPFRDAGGGSIGVQLIGRPLGEPTILAAAAVIEAAPA